MTLSQFSCPHCSNPFQVDTSSPAQQVACPHCSQPVSVTNEPPIATPPSIAEPPPAASPVAPPVASVGSRDAVRAPVDYSPADLLPPTRVVAEDRSQVVLNRDAVVPSHTEVMTGDVPIEPQLASPPIPVAPPEEQQVATDDMLLRQQVADDRASRQFIKNTIVWTFCAIVLLVILAYFIRPGGT